MRNYIKITRKTLDPNSPDHLAKRYKHLCEFIFFNNDDFNSVELETRAYQLANTGIVSGQIRVFRKVSTLPFMAVGEMV